MAVYFELKDREFCFVLAWEHAFFAPFPTKEPGPRLEMSLQKSFGAANR